jgi:transcriptional regulator with XRE-family HTH domain
LSLRKLAEEAGVSPSLISQIENGKTQPSVQTLYAIVHCLDITVDELTHGSEGSVAEPGPGGTAERALAAEPTGASHVPPPMSPVAPSLGTAPVLRKPDEHRKIEMEGGVTWEQLAGWGSDDVEVILVTYPPGSSSSVEGRLSRHNGTEYAYLIDGALTLHLEFDTYELAAGSSVHFDSTRPHMYVNDSDELARGVWFQLVRRDRWYETASDAQAGNSTLADG